MLRLSRVKQDRQRPLDGLTSKSPGHAELGGRGGRGRVEECLGHRPAYVYEPLASTARAEP